MGLFIKFSDFQISGPLNSCAYTYTLINEYKKKNWMYCIFFAWVCTYEPKHDISNNVVCAISKASDQPAHTRSLIRAFASRLNIL